MSAEIPMERAYQRTCRDSNQSVQPPVPATCGISEMEHQGDRLDPPASLDEPMVDKTHPDLSSLLRPNNALPVGPAPANLDAAAVETVNQSMQQVPGRPYEVVQQQIDQIHKVLQEQSRLLTLLGTVSLEGLMFPAYVPLWWIGPLPLPNVMSSAKLPVIPLSSSPPSDGRRLEDHPVPTCCSRDAFKDATEERRVPTIMGTDETVHRDGDQDPDPEDRAPMLICRSAVVEKQTLRRCVEEQLKVNEISEPKQLQNLSGMMTERRHFLQEGEGISRMDRNNLKVTDQQEVQRKVSLSQQLPSRQLTSGSQRRSSAPSMVFKDEGPQLETFQSLTSQPECSREFGTLQDFCSGSYNPQTPQSSQRNTQTEISLVCSQKQMYFNTHFPPQPETAPFQVKQIADATDRAEKVIQLQERDKSRERSHLEEQENSDNTRSDLTESIINRSYSNPTASVGKSVREKRVRHRGKENQSETVVKIVDKGEVKGQFESTAPLKKVALSSEDRWEQQQNNTRIWTPEHPSAMYESEQHFNISPPVRDNRVSPRACPNQEVIVSLKTFNDHMGRVSSLNMETLSTGCDETKTHLHLSQCSKSGPGSSVGSNWVEGQKLAPTAGAFCLCAPNHTSQASTPQKRSTFPTHSTTSASGGGGSSEDKDNPSSQCHQFPKLPSPPPSVGLQDFHLNLSKDGYGSEAGEQWMSPSILALKQNQRLGSEQGAQKQSFSSRSNTDDTTHEGDQKMLKIRSLKPQSKPDSQDDTKMAQTSWGFHRESVDRKDELKRDCEGQNVLSDREESKSTRNQHSPNKLGSRKVQALRQQVEALQQHFKQRERDLSVVRWQLQELIRENAELREKLMATPQCRPVGERRTAETHTVHQEGQTEMEQLLCTACNLAPLSNSASKVIPAERKTKTVTFFNGDIKFILDDGKVVYHYAASQITHTTYPTGLEVLHFPNKQIEKRHPGGKREILFPDQTIKYLDPDGSERTIFPDGTIVLLSPSGEKLVDFPSGRREIHTPQYKRREDPDGTVKTIYSNGRQETKYASGRVRIKEKDKVTSDSLN